MERKPLSTRQQQIMEILWNAEGGMTASAIVNAREDLQINTVQASLRSLLKKKYVNLFFSFFIRGLIYFFLKR